MSLVDPRVTKQAKILVNYSIKVKKGDNVVLLCDFVAKPLALEIYKVLLRAGAKEIKLHFSDYEFAEAYLKNASLTQIKTFPKLEFYETKHMDCYIRIGSPTNTRALSNIDTKLISERAKVTRPILNWRVDKTRWVVTKFPTDAQAQEANMSLSEYEDFVFSAINDVDWKKLGKEQEKLAKRVNKTGKVHIVGPQTDLRLIIKGRHAINASGEYNMPDGEVFTSVHENGANGYITFTYPAIYIGREYHDVRLEFKDGKIIKATASKGEDTLNAVLDTDPGARRIGELGIGNNFKINKFTKDILFDEKIGGSIHIAMGRGYKETKSLNESAIHWDMIKDLRKGGEIWFDDKLFQKNGKWIF